MANHGSTITAAVITLNEEKHISACLACLGWADELLVVDAHSADGTVLLAQQTGARVLLRPFDTFARQRNYAIQQAHCDWIFFVDADERVEPALAQEVLGGVRGGPDSLNSPVGYWVARRNLILGRWVRHAGWWPDYQLRLFRRSLARYNRLPCVAVGVRKAIGGNLVAVCQAVHERLRVDEQPPGAERGQHQRRDPHEVVQIDGPTAHLSHSLLHYNYSSFKELLSRQAAYAQREASWLFAEGVQPYPHRYITQPAREFFRRYVQLEGYKDGPLGFLLALLMAWYRFQIYVNLRRLR